MVCPRFDISESLKMRLFHCSRTRHWFLLWLVFILSGCELIFQAGPALSGRAYDEYQKSIKAYIEYWEKPGMTTESRLRDWVACGGNKNGTFSWATRKMLPGETEDQTGNRQAIDFQRCMLRSGYRYTGNCSSDWAKTQPSCGAP